ncbi:hypothetical protein [Methylobacterium sp. J-067]|uniref:hypothetical protein n=1 Tax=Methylobacterium sp. J-067 TaxID=2836648 RepID=UPI001FB8B6EB|nr:hypothetical protein [Methylobacterium sp. J-067]MCJ2025103.1 hypothetical protein [Methylobacterium sp. J-067]
MDSSRAKNAGGAPLTADIPPPAVNDRYIHSDVFERLVLESGDLAGLVAYGYYQQRKRQWIDACKAKGAPPTEQQIKDFAFGFQEDQLKALKSEAEGTLFRFGESMIESRMADMQETVYNAKTTEELTKLKSKIEHISGYKHHIVGHVVGFVVLLFLAFTFNYIITYEPHIAGYFSKNQSAH